MTLSVRLSHRVGAFALDVRFVAPPGVTVLFGRSGAGKSTVVQAVAGLIRPDHGHVSLGDQVLTDTETGQHLPPHKRRIGYVFQEGRLFPHLTVHQNLRYGRWMNRLQPDPAAEARMVDLLGIKDLLDRRPAGLSGGEKQRVAIGRALLAAPRLILADEPLAALDDARKAEILPYFERLRDAYDIPILYVSHAVSEVARLATTVVALDAGQVVAHGKASEVLADPMVTPLGVRAAGAVIDATVARHHDDGLTELAAGGATLFLPRLSQSIGAAVRVRIPAQDVIVATSQPADISALNVLAASVDSIRDGAGPGALVALDTPAGRILARVTRRSVVALDLRVGQPCYAIVKSVAIAADDITGAPADRSAGL